MNLVIIAVSLTILVPLAAASATGGDCTTTSDACPDGSQCVDRFCIESKYDPRRTMRSAETCAKLNCAEDEGCYLRDTIDASGTTVSTTLICSKKRPCETTQCDDDHYCEESVTGDQPPVAQCKPYGAETDYDPCKTKQCPDGTMCALRRALCNEKTCIWEPLCAKAQACWDCKLYYQFCEIFGKDGDAVGVCRDFKDRYSGW